jgi:hypothetical protein
LVRRATAVAAVEEAAGIYRRLADANPAAYLPDLAMSLWALGRSEEAAEIRQQLTAEDATKGLDPA